MFKHSPEERARIAAERAAHIAATVGEQFTADPTLLEAMTRPQMVAELNVAWANQLNGMTDDELREMLGAIRARMATVVAAPEIPAAEAPEAADATDVAGEASEAAADAPQAADSAPGDDTLPQAAAEAAPSGADAPMAVTPGEVISVTGQPSTLTGTVVNEVSGDGTGEALPPIAGDDYPQLSDAQEVALDRDGDGKPGGSLPGQNSEGPTNEELREAIKALGGTAGKNTPKEALIAKLEQLRAAQG